MSHSNDAWATKQCEECVRQAEEKDSQLKFHLCIHSTIMHGELVPVPVYATYLLENVGFLELLLLLRREGSTTIVWQDSPGIRDSCLTEHVLGHLPLKILLSVKF